MRLLVLFTLLTMLFSSCYYPRGWHMMDGWSHMAWWGYGGAFMWLIFLVLVGVAVYFVMRSEKWMKRGGSDETALDILKKRYAKGDISKKEYETMKKELE